MVHKFVRGVKDLGNVKKQPFYTNDQNDLLSESNGEVYVRTQKDKKGQYYQLTNAIKTINGKAPDDTRTGDRVGIVESVNGVKPNENGAVTIPTGGGIMPTTVDYTTTNYKYEFYFEGEGLGSKYEMTFRKFSTPQATKMEVIQENDNDCTWGFEAYEEGNYDIDMYEIESGERVYHTVISVIKPTFAPVKIQVSKDSKMCQVWFDGDLSSTSVYNMRFNGVTPETDAELPLVGQYQDGAKQTMFSATIPDNYTGMLYLRLRVADYNPDLPEGYVAWFGSVTAPASLG